MKKFIITIFGLVFLIIFYNGIQYIINKPKPIPISSMDNNEPSNIVIGKFSTGLLFLPMSSKAYIESSEVVINITGTKLNGCDIVAVAYPNFDLNRITLKPKVLKCGVLMFFIPQKYYDLVGDDGELGVKNGEDYPNAKNMIIKPNTGVKLEVYSNPRF